MNYLELRKRYAFYRKVAIVLAVLLILFVALMVKDRTIQTLCIIHHKCTLIPFDLDNQKRVFKKWY